MKKAAKLSIAAVMAALALSACTPDPAGPGVMDQQKPVIHSVTATPNSVGANQTLTISAQVTDNIGVTGVAFVVRHNNRPVDFCTGNALMAEGTVQSGTWTLSCVTPEIVNAGEYQVNTAVVDAKFNSQVTVDGPPSVTSGHFTVTGDVNDSEGPVVTSVTSAPNVVAREGNLTVTAAVTDASGVAHVTFVVRRNGSAPGWCAAAAELISGTAQDGIWQMTCPVPANAIVGDYIVNSAVSDVLNNLSVVGDLSAPELLGGFSVN